MRSARLVLLCLAALVLTGSVQARVAAAPAAPQNLKPFLLRAERGAEAGVLADAVVLVAARTRRHPLRVRALEERGLHRGRHLLVGREAAVAGGIDSDRPPLADRQPLCPLRSRPGDHHLGRDGLERSYGFNVRWATAPQQLASDPGMSRWTVVPGATSYEVWFVDVFPGKVVATKTNAVDHREFYAFHQGSSFSTTVRFRVRAVRNLYGSIPTGPPGGVARSVEPRLHLNQSRDRRRGRPTGRRSQRQYEVDHHDRGAAPAHACLCLLGHDVEHRYSVRVLPRLCLQRPRLCEHDLPQRDGRIARVRPAPDRHAAPPQVERRAERCADSSAAGRQRAEELHRGRPRDSGDGAGQEGARCGGTVTGHIGWRHVPGHSRSGLHASGGRHQSPGDAGPDGCPRRSVGERLAERSLLLDSRPGQVRTRRHAAAQSCGRCRNRLTDHHRRRRELPGRHGRDRCRRVLGARRHHLRQRFDR